MIKMYCDKCNSDITDLRRRCKFKWELNIHESTPLVYEYDLCPSCAKQVRRFLTDAMTKKKEWD